MKKFYLIPIIIVPLIILYFTTKKKPEIIHPKVGPITESVYAISTVKSERTYTLRLGVISSVEKYFVKEGDEVNANDKLLSLEGGTLFKTPHAGIVTERPYGLKETIIPQSTIIKIVDLKNLYLEASIEQVGALKINKGMKVVVSFDDFRNKLFIGTVRSVLPRDQDFLIQVNVLDLPNNVLPGMSADLSVEIGKKEKAILIPTKAISNGFIIVKKENKNEKIKVELGINDSENAEIISPILTEQDEIVIPKLENK
jgi:multidrug efflux pump subunit AcrA (membrane-fusion protein)